jgi:P4 family phage/plasmid primase-like protien
VEGGLSNPEAEIHIAESELRPAVECDPTLIPAALRERPQWVCWKYVYHKGKPTKCPMNACRGGKADSTDPATWASFDEAVAAWKANAYAGIGYVFSADDRFCGIDLDGCIDDSGSIVSAAQQIIDDLNSYTEISPSGRGVKVIVAGRKPEGSRCRSKAIAGFKETEVYDRDRFFTLTGRLVSDTPAEVEDRQAALDALCMRLWPKQPVPQLNGTVASGGFTGDDEELIERAGEAKNGDRFKKLWAGDTSLHGDDHSGADQALCNLLAFWTSKDQERMDRLFRRSGLFRPKWDEKRGARKYGQMTIDKAIEGCRDTYSPPRRDASTTLPPDVNGEPEPSEDGDSLVSLGKRDLRTGRLVLSPRQTLPTAEAYVREFNQHADGRTLHGYGGVLMEWSGNRYSQVEEELIKHKLQPWLHEALRYVTNKKTGEIALTEFESNPTTVKQAFDTIRTFVHLPASTVSPTWLDGGEGRPPAIELLPCKSMNLHIPTGRVIAATPSLFTINALDFDYDPDPEPPLRWIKFLDQLFGEDLESVELLQEWLGYCLTSDTSQQKMLMVVGPKRSGKGTIGRILRCLVGEENVVGPTTGSIAGTFGLQPLIGKSLAIVSDARFGGEHVGTVVERLLCISGEDTLTIDRKHIGSVSMKLATRFVFLTNELPRLNDASTALAGRFLMLRLKTSFYGKEDVTLTDQLLAELPGILLWAIEGWKRLRARGRFVQPESSEEAVRDMEDLASPVGAFVRQCCVVGVGHRVWVDDFYNAWKTWCTQEGRDYVSTKQSLGRDLMAAAPGVVRRRGKNMEGFYEGIGLQREVPPV